MGGLAFTAVKMFCITLGDTARAAEASTEWRLTLRQGVSLPHLTLFLPTPDRNTGQN